MCHLWSEYVSNVNNWADMTYPVTHYIAMYSCTPNIYLEIIHILTAAELFIVF